MERTFIEDLQGKVGETVKIAGWISVRRDQGKMVFFDFRDMTGTVQGVVLPKSDAIEVAKDASRESSVYVEGIVNQRPEKNVNPEVQNGSIELEVVKLEIVSAAATLPFEISEDTSGINEETRLQYRYLDLRSERLQKNLHLRSEFVRRCREYLFSKKFTEIETPLLTESTPEGSRDFVVPSRLNPGNFYALPQSPQQYKQLLMVAGFERYFQIARAVRDEDLRADRGFEHTQVDIEMLRMPNRWRNTALINSIGAPRRITRTACSRMRGCISSRSSRRPTKAVGRSHIIRSRCRFPNTLSG